MCWSECRRRHWRPARQLTAGASESPSAEAEVSARLAEIGIEHDFGPAGISLSLEDWGDEGNLESRDWRGELFFGGERYRLGLTYETRAIDILYIYGG